MQLKPQPATTLDIVARLPLATAFGVVVGELAIGPLAAALSGQVPNPAMAAVIYLPVGVGVVMAALAPLAETLAALGGCSCPLVTD